MLDGRKDGDSGTGYGGGDPAHQAPSGGGGYELDEDLPF